MSYFFPPVGPTTQPYFELELANLDPVALQLSVQTQNGLCIPRAESDPYLQPCIRNSNGKLLPNSNQPQACRYFPQYLGSNMECPTICPEACVELWENCPAGTGVLTSVVHTKTTQDVLQLSGKVGPTGQTNPMYEFSKNYKSYTECYSFGTEFCELPETRMQHINGENKCFKDCPIGMVQDTTPGNELDCIFTNNISIQCNPQYFTPIAGGCRKKALPTQKTASCPVGFETFVNPQFAVEWCMQTCPVGFVHDITYSSCIATCTNSSQNPNDWSSPNQYSAFRDVLDFYGSTNSALSFRCKDTTKPCVLGNQPGRCPVNRYQDPESKYANTYESKNRPSNMPSRQFSVESLPKQARSSTDNATYLPLLAQAVQRLSNFSTVNAYPEPTTQITCPTGMVVGLPFTDEKPGFCYDVCNDLFNSAEICRTTGQVRQSISDPTLQCDTNDIQPICIANCPAGWKSKVLTGGPQPVYTCEYIYPNNVVPTDPNLFKDCPSNGTFIVQEPGDAIGPAGNPLPPTPQTCVRKIYQRNVSCPLNYTYAKILGNDTCLENCQDGTVPIEIIVEGIPVIFCTGTGPIEDRYIQGLDSMYNNVNNSLQPSSQFVRKNQTNGFGYDPLQLFQASNGTVSSISTLAVIFGAFLVILLLQRLFR